MVNARPEIWHQVRIKLTNNGLLAEFIIKQREALSIKVISIKSKMWMITQYQMRLKVNIK